MMRFVPGQDVSIPCLSAHGALPGEAFVTLESAHGTISGFVRREHLLGSESRAFVRGQVTRVTGDLVVVRTAASFFTTAAGTAAFSSAWAGANSQLLPA